MAIVPETRYPGQTVSSDVTYPHGKARNDSSASSTDGTPLEEGWVNDLWGLLQGLLAEGGITPSGDPDTASVSQYKDAIHALITNRLASFANDTETSGGIIYVDQHTAETGYGTASRPYQTIAEALTRISAGDADSEWLINIGPGSYTVSDVLPAGRRVTMRGASCKSSHRTLFTGAATLGWSPTGASDTIEFQNIDWGGELNVGGSANWTAYFRDCNVPYVYNLTDFIGSLHIAGPMCGTLATTSYPMCTFEGTAGTYAAGINLYATGMQFVRDFTVNYMHLNGCDSTGSVEMTITASSSAFGCTKSSGTWDITRDGGPVYLTLDAMTNYFRDTLTNITTTLAHQE